MTDAAIERLCARLEARLQSHHGDGYLPAHANPDGPEAAALIRSQAERVKALEGALETIAEGHDVGRHDGLPEDGPAHDADTMFAIARFALNHTGET